jgi:hypothetical protein
MLALAGSTAGAATITQTVTANDGVVVWTGQNSDETLHVNASLNPFDSTLGTLTAVRMELDSDFAFGLTSLENPPAAFVHWDLQHDATVRASSLGWEFGLVGTLPVATIVAPGLDPLTAHLRNDYVLAPAALWSNGDGFQLMLAYNVSTFEETDPPDPTYYEHPASFGGSTASVNSTFRLLYDYTPFSAPVPEPMTWALMIGGFGLVGSSLRRRAAGSRLAG